MKELISNCEILTRCEDLVCNTPVHGRHYLGYYNAGKALQFLLP